MIGAVICGPCGQIKSLVVKKDKTRIFIGHIYKTYVLRSKVAASWQWYYTK